MNEVHIMDSREFNKKYAKFIRDCSYGLDISNKLVIEYLDFLFSSELIKIPDFKYSQIKLKFGKARFYSQGLSEEERQKIEFDIDKIISENPDE